MNPRDLRPALPVLVSVIEPPVSSLDAVGVPIVVAPSGAFPALDRSLTSTIGLLCLDQHAKVFRALALMTSTDPAFGVVIASTSRSTKEPFDPAKVSAEVVRHQTNIVVLGNVSERPDVFSLVRDIRSLQPTVRCVFLSSDVCQSTISAAFKYGASGYFAKGDDQHDILNGLKRIAVCHDDEFVLGQKVMAQCRMWGGGQMFALAVLSPRRALCS